MELLLERRARRATYTIGWLYVNGVKFCETLEDTDRGLTSDMPLSEIRRKKVYGQTAIPTGTYEITLNVLSPRYSKKNSYREITAGGYMPRLVNVKGFDGVLVHGGNKTEDTYGCLLVGENKVKGGLINSFNTFKRLYVAMTTAVEDGENIYITIK